MKHTNFKLIINKICENSSKAARIISCSSQKDKNQALKLINESLLDNKDNILKANTLDVENSIKNNLSKPLLDRLSLDEEKILSMSKSIKNIIKLPDPVNNIIEKWKRPNGLKLFKVTVPFGVIGIIYESRPNVTADAAALCIKSGNCAILRGGRESFLSSKAIMKAITDGLKASSLDKNTVQIIPTISREAVNQLLKMDKYIDVIIPRGGKNLISKIKKNSNIPVFSHLDGICHTYIDEYANKDQAIQITLNAKMRRTSICGATETVLIHKNIKKSILHEIVSILIKNGCEIRGDSTIKKINPKIKKVSKKDWDTEYLDAIVSIKIVTNISDAIGHINTHSSHHTDAIITDNKRNAKRFLNEINSAIVMHNTSTQFADGAEFGLGAEIGIATGKLHARGPVGIKELVTYKYIVQGTGQIRN